jgi:hypothetical protein
MNKQAVSKPDIFQIAKERARMYAQEQERIRSVMSRQVQRDVAAARGQMVPFSQADII